MKNDPRVLLYRYTSWFHNTVRRRYKIIFMVVAQLVKRLLPNPEIHGSNPVISNVYFTIKYF